VGEHRLAEEHKPAVVVRLVLMVGKQVVGKREMGEDALISSCGCIVYSFAASGSKVNDQYQEYKTKIFLLLINTFVNTNQKQVL
jgi:hypothetical protein